MTLFLSAVVSGVGVGFLYGLMGLSLAILYKSTGIISFAQPAVAMVLAFVAQRAIAELGLPLLASVLFTAVVAAAAGAVIYLLLFRPNEGLGAFNLVLRTIALSLVLEQVVVYTLSEGEPFTFPQFVSGPSLTAFGVSLPRQNVVIIVTTLVLLGALLMFFRTTRAGLLLRAVAESPYIVGLLGVKNRRLTILAWALSIVTCAFVAVLAAPVTLVSSTMFAPYVLYAFTAFILGGITSWGGSIAGGLIVGIASNVTVVYIGTEVAALVTFAILLVILLIRPQGLFGTSVRERL